MFRWKVVACDTIGDEQLRNVTPNAFSRIAFTWWMLWVLQNTKRLSLQQLMSLRQRPLPSKNYWNGLVMVISPMNIWNGLQQHLPESITELIILNEKSLRTWLTVIWRNCRQEYYTALENDTLPPFINANEPNSERKGLVSPLANHADARRYCLSLLPDCQYIDAGRGHAYLKRFLRRRSKKYDGGIRGVLQRT